MILWGFWILWGFFNSRDFLIFWGFFHALVVLPLTGEFSFLREHMPISYTKPLGIFQVSGDFQSRTCNSTLPCKVHCSTTDIFELRVVFALLLLPNHLQLNSCVSSLVPYDTNSRKVSQYQNLKGHLCFYPQPILLEFLILMVKR